MPCDPSFRKYGILSGLVSHRDAVDVEFLSCAAISEFQHAAQE